MSIYFTPKILVIFAFGSFFIVGVYCIYAVVKNKTLARSDDPNNIIPFPYNMIKGFLKPILMIIGITFSLVGLYGVFGAIFGWL